MTGFSSDGELALAIESHGKAPWRRLFISEGGAREASFFGAANGRRQFCAWLSNIVTLPRWSE